MLVQKRYIIWTYILYLKKNRQPQHDASVNEDGVELPKKKNSKQGGEQLQSRLMCSQTTGYATHAT